MRQHLPLLGAGVALWVLCTFGLELAPDNLATDVFPWLQLPMVALWAGSSWWVWRRPGCHPALIVAIAVACRLGAASSPPALSSDVYRYPWDGRVQRAGFSPWAHPPAAAQLAPLRDASIHPHINRPHSPTIYPPGAQWLFALLPFDVDHVRWCMIALDLLTLLLLARLLAIWRRDPARVVLYGWAPLAIWEVGNGGHLEAAMLPLLVGAALLLANPKAWGRLHWAGLCFGQAVAMKLYPLALAPALWRRGGWRMMALAGLTVASLYGVYGAQAGGDILGFLPQYVGPAEDHNIGLRRLFEWAANALGAPHTRALAFAACAGTFLTGALWLQRRPLHLSKHLLALAGLWLLCLPTALHPWYALWLLPWLAVSPRLGWLWLVAALPLSYLKYGAAGGVMPAWVVPVEWLPTIGLLVAGALRASRGPREAH